jgi:hypothetical protein
MKMGRRFLFGEWRFSRSKNLDAKAQRGKELREKVSKTFAFLAFLAFFASKFSVF